MIMKNRNYMKLRMQLNSFVDEGYAYIPAWAPAIYGEVDRPGQWSFVHTTLAEWEDKGFLKVLKNPEQCAADDICIEMFNFIDSNKHLPINYLSKIRFPPKWPHSYRPGTMNNRGQSVDD